MAKTVQVRTYTVRPDRLDKWVDRWRTLVVPLRRSVYPGRTVMVHSGRPQVTPLWRNVRGVDCPNALDKNASTWARIACRLPQ